MLMIRVFRTRSGHSPLRLLLSLDRASVPMVSSGPCKQPDKDSYMENLTMKHFEKMDKYNKLAIDL